MSPYARALRLAAIVAALAITLIPVLGGPAVGEETLGGLEEQMDALRSELDASAARIEKLRSREAELRDGIDAAETRIASLKKENAKLTAIVAERADELYRSGGAGVVEALLMADDFAEFTDRAEMIARVSADDADIFVRLARSSDEMSAVAADLETRKKELGETVAALEDENAELQDKLASVESQYEQLKRQQAREAAAAAAAAAQQATSSSALTLSAPQPISVPVSTGGKTCPVGGPVSFVDSWGAPRSGGRSHEGVDMMADYGTPVVAITSGTITYAGYGGSAGNWLILSGNDGNGYWYMHNQENLVSGGSVSAGQQIATVGDTGNAVGTPHLHFEYHPGGGGAVNPYSLVAAIC